MSLINQMLKDLEQRNAKADRTAPLAGEVRAVSVAGREGGVPLWGIGLALAIVLLLVGGFAWWHASRAPAPPTQAAPIMQVTVAPRQSEVPPLPEPGGYVPATAEQQAPAAPAGEPAAGVPEKRFPGLDLTLAAAPAPGAAQASRPATEPQSSHLPTPPKETSTKPQQGSALAGGASRPLKTVSATQQAENAYRQAVAALQQGRVAEAQDQLRKVLEINPRHVDARQMLVGLMVDARQHADATALLQEGLKLSPEQSGFSMALARLQVESGDVQSGLATLEQGVKAGGVDAEYQGFYAALLQRQGRHEEAVQHYLAALNVDPAMPTWLVGIGISLENLGKRQDAQAAFQRARDTGQLTPQLMRFVDQRLAELRRS